MKKRDCEFESGHPDEKTRANSGFTKKRVGALGALVNSDLFDVRGEILNQKREEMIKSVVIKDCRGDISKRWHVEYKEFNPETDAWERKREYGYVNREKDLQSRREKINELYKEIITSLGNRFKSEKKGQNIILKRIQYYLQDKSTALKAIKNHRLALRYFYSFLKQNDLLDLGLHQITKQHIHEFKVELNKFTGIRSVNNHLDFVSGFFNYYINNFDDVVYKNPVNLIDRDEAVSESHVAYKESEATKYFEVMEEKNPQLFLYCKCISLGFLRCNEARQLRISDIDFINRTITLPAYRIKQKKRTVKPMLDIFYNLLIEYKIYSYPGDYFLFSHGGQPGQTMVGKNYFRKRYRKIIKKPYKLDKKYSAYGFRHTTVTKLLTTPAPWVDIMKFTGHKDMKSFEQYARSLFLKPAQDLSGYIVQMPSTNHPPLKRIS